MQTDSFCSLDSLLSSTRESYFKAPHPHLLVHFHIQGLIAISLPCCFRLPSPLNPSLSHQSTLGAVCPFPLLNFTLSPDWPFITLISSEELWVFLTYPPKSMAPLSSFLSIDLTLLSCNSPSLSSNTLHEVFSRLQGSLPLLLRLFPFLFLGSPQHALTPLKQRLANIL